MLRLGTSSAASLRQATRPGISFSGAGQTRGMATLKEIQLRLKSIKNIAKITKSMKMIASTKLVRAQRNMETARAYGETSNAVFKFLDPKAATDTAAKSVVIACSSDRGLCGAIHGTIAKPIRAKLRADPKAFQSVVIGDKARGQISRASREAMLMSFNGVGKNLPTFDEAAVVAEKVLDAKKDEPAEISIYYNKFKSVIAYELTVLPAPSESSLSANDKLSQYELEDDAVIKNFAEFTLANSLYQALAEGYASEMSARRTAMENATKNAGDMIDKLTMIYNRSRQATITNELVDIITGASAL